MLESLYIQNFQKHEDRLIEFDQITTIVGPSDRGKSSIIWALSWVCYNVPEGMDFITHGQTEAQATLKVDGHEVARKRSKKENTYTLDQQEPPFKAFKTTPPEPIVQLLNLHECSFQYQLDAAFWLSDKGRSVAEQMNAIINLSVMDESLEASNKILRAEKGTLELTESRLKSCQQEQQNLEWVLQCSADIENLGNKEQEIAKAALELDKLKHLRQGLREARTTRRKQQLQNLHALITKGKEVQSLIIELAALKNFRTEFIQLQETTERPTLPLEQLRRIKKEYTTLQEELLRLRATKTRLQETNQSIVQQRKQLQTIQALIPKRCPQCQQPLIPSASTSPTSISTKKLL